MKRRAAAVAISAVTAIGTLTALPVAAQADDRTPGKHDRLSRSAIARQTLPKGDGWASLDAGTTGGAAAPKSNVVTVRTRDQLAQAVAGNAPKIVFVAGRIDANTDSAGQPLTCADYA